MHPESGTRGGVWLSWPGAEDKGGPAHPHDPLSPAPQQEWARRAEDKGGPAYPHDPLAPASQQGRGIGATGLLDNDR